MIPRRPMRSVFLGNPRYLSVYALGVAQAMGAMGHWHRYVSLFESYDDVCKQIAEMRPDVIWTHMALWPPPGALSPEGVASVLSHWKGRGACVFLHDGDPRPGRQTEVDVGSVFSIALVNRSVADGHWRVPSIRWPYAAMMQKEIGDPMPEWDCDLLFAGHLRGDSIYGERTSLVHELQKTMGTRMITVAPGDGPINNRMLVADVSPSAGAILGFGRPEVPGWIDTRVFQYPGAGGVLIHDDAGEFLEPDLHYIRYQRHASVYDTMASVLDGVGRARQEGAAIRARAFRYIQENHTWLQRCTLALEAFYGR